MKGKNKAQETLAVLALAALVILGTIKKEWIYGTYTAIFFLFIGLFIPPLAILIHKTWILLAKIISEVNVRLILSLVFFFILTSIAFVKRLTSPDSLHIKPPEKSVFTIRNHLYTSEDLENPY